AGIRGLVAEHVQVQPGFEAAIAAALGSLADAVLADNRDSAIDALTHAGDSELGRVELVLADAAVPEPTTSPELVEGRGSAPEKLPEGTVHARSVVTAPPGILGLLNSVVIADDLEAARAAWAALAASESLTVITRSGDVLS